MHSLRSQSQEGPPAALRTLVPGERQNHGRSQRSGQCGQQAVGQVSSMEIKRAPRNQTESFLYQKLQPRCQRAHEGNRVKLLLYYSRLKIPVCTPAPWGRPTCAIGSSFTIVAYGPTRGNLLPCKGMQSAINPETTCKKGIL